MNGAGSSGQQRMIGRRSRSTSSPVSTTSWHGAFETVFGAESAIDLSVPSPDLVDEALGRRRLEDLLERFGGDVVEPVDPKARHMRRSVPN